MTDKELLPCPISGEVALKDVWTPEDGQHRDYGRNTWIVTIKSSIISVSGSSLVSEEEAYKRAIKAWNTRAKTQREKELVEALKGLSDMYGAAFDRVDGDLVMMGSHVDLFEACHAKAQEVLFKATEEGELWN